MLEKLRFIYLFIWNNVPGRNFKSVESLNGELMSSIIHVLPLIFSIFTCLDPDPYSEYGSRSTRVLNADQIWIRIHNNAHESWFSWTSSVYLNFLGLSYFLGSSFLSSCPILGGCSSILSMRPNSSASSGLMNLSRSNVDSIMS